MSAGVYLRVSSEEQRERQTILTQREFLGRWLDLHSISGLEWYVDDGVSGSIPLEERPEGARLVRDIEAGAIRSVYVFRLDRLARNPRLLLNAAHKLEEMNCHLISATEAFDTSTPAGRAMLGMLAVFAGFERDSIVERCNAGTERAAREGVWLGGKRPFGYQIEGQGREARLVVDPTEAEVVRIIYRMIADDRRSCGDVAKVLNATGVPTVHQPSSYIVPRTGRPNSGTWSVARVHKIVKSRIYYGQHDYGKQTRRNRELISRPVPAIVDTATWERAQEVMEERRTYGPETTKHSYLLRGKLWCAQCGRKYHGATFGKYQYYRCANARSDGNRTGPTCKSRHLPLRVERHIWEDIEYFLRHPGPVLEQLAEQQRAAHSHRDQSGEELARLKAGLAEKVKERERIVTLYRKGRIDEETLDSQMMEVEEEEALLRAEQTRCQRRANAASASTTALHEAEALLRQLGERIDQGVTQEEKRRITELLVSRITVAEEDGEITLQAMYSFNAPIIDGGRWCSLKERGLM